MCKISDANKINKIYLGSSGGGSKQEGTKREGEQRSEGNRDLHNEASNTGVRWTSACSLVLS